MAALVAESEGPNPLTVQVILNCLPIARQAYSILKSEQPLSCLATVAVFKMLAEMAKTPNSLELDSLVQVIDRHAQRWEWSSILHQAQYQLLLNCLGNEELTLEPALPLLLIKSLRGERYKVDLQSGAVLTSDFSAFALGIGLKHRELELPHFEWGRFRDRDLALAAERSRVEAPQLSPPRRCSRMDTIDILSLRGMERHREHEQDLD
jgi:hypothetical protein